MSDALVARAGENDIAAFAASRCGDAGSARLYRTLAAIAPGGAWVAKDGEEPVGIAFAHTYQGAVQLTECFVHPSQRNAGLGSALCDAALGETERRFVVFEANDASAAAFAMRAGFAIREPLLHACGAVPNEEAVLALAASGGRRFRVADVDPVTDGHALDALDRETIGFARIDDHARFAGSAVGCAFFLEDEFVGYAYVWPDGRVGPLACASPTYVGALFAFALVALQRRHGATWCSLLVPGSNLRLMRAAIACGLKVDRAYDVAGDVSDADFSRYAPAHPLLF